MMDNGCKPLGILGGMSWVSTQLYYQLINEGIKKRRGKQHSANLLIASVDFQSVIDAQVAGDWEGLGGFLGARALGLGQAGVGAFLIASNTMHLVFDRVAALSGLPGLDIFDAIAVALHRDGRRRIGLLGTRYTMKDPFFLHAYARRGIEVIVPELADANKVNEIIFKELIHGKIKAESAAFYRDVVDRLTAKGADAVVLGCTEIGLLLDVNSSTTPLYDSTILHASMAVDWLMQS